MCTLVVYTLRGVSATGAPRPMEPLTTKGGNEEWGSRWFYPSQETGTLNRLPRYRIGVPRPKLCRVDE